MSKQLENLLQTLIEEVRFIRQHVVPPDPPTPEELTQDLTRVLGTGPDDAFNK